MQMMDSKTNGEEISEPTCDATPPNNAQNHTDQIKTVLKTTENYSNTFDDGIKEDEIPF
jgi:hypothetical protein